MAAVLVCNKCGAINWNLSSAGANHAQLADEVKGYEACDGIWQQGRWPQLRLITGRQASQPYTGQVPANDALSHIRVTLNLGIFEQLLAQVPDPLAQKAMADAERTIPALCFTEADIHQRCEEDERWATLSKEAQAEFIESLLDCGEYEHAAETASEAIAETVEKYINEELAGAH